MKARLAAALTVLLACWLQSASAGAAPIAEARVTTDDMARVYEAFLADWRVRDPDPVNVVRSAEAPGPADLAEYTACAKANGSTHIAWTPGTPIASLGGTIGHLSYIHFVDPLPQDSQELFAKVQAMTLGEYWDGFLILSAVTFDASHDTAAVTYAFACGLLCGNGGFATFRRTGESWTKDKRPCASAWISSAPQLYAPTHAGLAFRGPVGLASRGTAHEEAVAH